MNIKKIFILVTSLILGALIIFEARSFDGLSEVFFRDTQSNIFKEIKIMKDKNESLRDEITGLQDTIEQLTDQNSALTAIEEEIEKYEKLSGSNSIFGPGIEIVINGDLTTPWATDLTNAIFNAGAQAVSVNGIRLTNQTIGFDTMPKGQILLNGSVILTSPYTFSAIGESSYLAEIFELPGGIFDKLEASFPNIKIETTHRDIIHMD